MNKNDNEKLNNLEEANIFFKTTPDKFIELRNKLEKDLYSFLTPHTELDYISKNTNLFLSKDMKSGFGINQDGELISVFALERKRGRILVEESVKRGAKYLNCIGEHLKNLYGEFGFTISEEIEWDDNFAPKDWNYEKFGKPKVYDMKLLEDLD